MLGRRRRIRNKRPKEVIEGSEEKGEDNGTGFPGKSSLPCCHRSRKDGGVKAEGSRNTTPEHVPQRGQRSHAGHPRGNLAEEMRGTEGNEFSPWKLQITLVSHCTIPLCRCVSSCRSRQKTGKEVSLLPPPQPPLLQHHSVLQAGKRAKKKPC